MFIIALFVIANNQNLETIKMPINGRTNEEIVVYSHKGILRHNEKEETTSASTGSLIDTMFSDRTKGKLTKATHNMDTYC